MISRMNGHPLPLEIGTIDPSRAGRVPLLGSARAPIRRPLNVPPSMVGKMGRAWQCDLDAARCKLVDRARQDATVAHWIVEAPWAHPVWHSYSLVVVHLRDLPGLCPPLLYLDGATHEMHVYAIDPDADRERMLTSPIDFSCWLSPLNFAAQFRAPSDAVAASRVCQTVALICDGRLSPDTDFMRDWVQLYGDNMLKRSRPRRLSTEP